MNAAVQSEPTVRPKRQLITLALILTLGATVLTAVDLFLESTELKEVQKQAQRSHEAGLNLLAAGDAAGAVDALRTAHARERKNLGYELDLVEALMAAGKSAEAEPLMTETLQRNSNDGRANLIAARLMVKEKRMNEADAYYHRAIYGGWPQDGAGGHRMSARLELIDFLVQRRRTGELLAELLPLQGEAGENANVQARLAHLFLVAGSPSRGADVYRAMIQHYPRDAAAYQGLGEAELEQGNYHGARAAFYTANLRKPEDATIHKQLDLTEQLTGLDPTPRRLPSKEKYHRSLRLLTLTRDDLEQCVSTRPAAASSDLERDLTAAGDALSRQVQGGVTNEVSEGILNLAVKLWQARLNACGGTTTPDEEPLRLIAEKLGQQ